MKKELHRANIARYNQKIKRLLIASSIETSYVIDSFNELRRKESKTSIELLKDLINNYADKY